MDIDALRLATEAFIRDNQAWAPLVAGVLAFGESLAILSVLFPATVLLLAVGALIGAIGLEFWPIWLGAAIGATLGDWVSYEVGRYFEDQAKHMWPLNRSPDLVERSERFIARFGIWGIFLGRFFGPLRALVPLVAGIFGMPRLPFQAANVASAMLWAFGLLAPGTGVMDWLRG